MFIKQQKSFECPKYTFKLEETLDTCNKTLYVVTYIKNIHHILVNGAVMCNTSKTASSNSEFLTGEILFRKILVTSQQSLRVKFLDSLFGDRLIHHHQ